MSGGAAASRTCTRSARSAAPDCTAPTGWLPPPCWKGWCGATAPRWTCRGTPLRRYPSGHACRDDRPTLGRIRSDRGFRPGPDPGRHADHPKYHVALRGPGAQRRPAHRAPSANCATCRTRSRPSTAHQLSDGLIGLRNAVEVALIVAQAARHNRQSRGCHFRSDAVQVGDRLL